MNTMQRKRVPRGRRRPAARYSAVRSRLSGASAPILTIAYVILLSLFGGGVAGWTPAYMLLCLATIVVTGAVAWRTAFVPLDAAPLAGKLAVIGIGVLPLLQLVPLPPGLWQMLPGQEKRQAVLTLVGLADTWQPLTVDPSATALSAILGVGFVALMTLLMHISDTAFTRVLDVAVGVVLFGIVLGIFQVVSDGQFPRLYPINMGAVMLGIYANKNHMGLVITCAMVLVGFVTSRRIADRGKRRATVIGIVVFALVCLVTTNSRAGLVLGLIGAVAVLASDIRATPWRYKIAASAVVVLLVGLVVFSSAFEVVSARFNDVDSDLRWQITTWSMPLAHRYALLGGGAASFGTLFNASEQLAWVKPTIVNAAHDDYLQLVIEFGVPGIAVLVMLVASVVVSIPALRILPRRDVHRAQMLFGLTVMLMFALHSAIDYPLRRPAAWVFFALALAAVYRGHAATRKAA